MERKRDVTFDAPLSAIIEWLQANNLVLHIPLKGPIYFTRKKPQ